MSQLLDTHVFWYWLMEPKKLTKTQAAVLGDVTSEQPAWISEITLWEISTLYSLGRLQLDMPLREWLERASAPPLVRRLSITPAIAAEVAALPDDFHRDPADRIIVSTARVHGVDLLTQDSEIIEAEMVSTIQ